MLIRGVAKAGKDLPSAMGRQTEVKRIDSKEAIANTYPKIDRSADEFRAVSNCCGPWALHGGAVPSRTSGERAQ